MYDIPNERRRMGMVVGVSGTPVTYYTLTGTTWIGDASDWSLFTIGSLGDYLPSTGGTVTGNVTFNSGITATTIYATNYENLPSFLSTSGGTLTGQLDGTTISATTISGTTFYGDGQYLSNLPKVTGFTYQPPGEPAHSLFIYTNYNTGFSVDLSLLAADVTITGGTYDPNTGEITFKSQGAPDFTVSGFTSGLTDTYISSASFNDTNGEITTTTNTGFNQFNITGLTYGSGTQNRAVIWNDNPKKQRASSLITDNNTSVGIGTLSPSASYVLDVSGDTRIGNTTGDITVFGNGITFDYVSSSPRISSNQKILMGVPNLAGSRTFIGTVGGNTITSGFTELEVGLGDLSQTGGTFNNTKLTGRILSSSGDTTLNFLSVEPIYQTAGSPYSGTVRGFYFNPNVLTTFNGRQVAFENTVGDVLFNTTSGGVGIGTTGITTGNKLDVVGNVDIQGKLKFYDGDSTTGGTIIRIGAGNLDVGKDNNNPQDAIFIGRGVATSITATTGSSSSSLISIGFSSSSSITTGGRYSVHLGRNSGRGITIGTQNTFIGSGDNTDIPSNTDNSIHLIAGGGYENNLASQALTGLTSRYVFIGGGFNTSRYINDFYLGAGPYVTRPDLSNLNLYAPSANGSNLVGSNFEINAGRGSGGGKGGDIIFRTSTSGSTGTSIQTLSQRLKIGGQDGKITVDSLVGSGDRMVIADSNGVLSTNTIPTGTLSGSGTGGYIARYSGASPSTTLRDSNIYDDGTQIGIGTAAPNYRLEVVATGNANAIRAAQTSTSTNPDDYNAAFGFQNRSTALNTYSLLSFQHTATGGGIGIARMGSKLTSLASNGSGDFIFQVKESGVFNEAIYVKSNGNVGIGDTNPSYKLSVSGTTYISGTTTLNSLAGTGDRMVVANSNGVLSTQTIPSGGGGYTVVKVTGSTYTASTTTGEVIILADASSNPITINLPTVVGNTGKYTIKKTDSSSNFITVDPISSETIDDGTTAEIKVQYESITLITDNTEWFII
jgi:hypothetical protein